MRFILALLLCLPLVANAITADSYIATDLYGNVLLEKNADLVRPIASITKIFVAEQAVKLDSDELLEVTRADLVGGRMKSTPLQVGKSYPRHQLTELALVSSDNVAALVLARHSPARTEFAEIYEGSGLDQRNQSSARKIAEASRLLYLTPVSVISVGLHTSLGHRNSTNPLLKKTGWNFVLSKTGFTNPAGGCLTAVVSVNGELRVITILGSRDVHVRWHDLIEIRRILGDTGFYDPFAVVTKRKQKVTK